MNKSVACGIMIFLMAGVLNAYGRDDMIQQPACPYCGMDQSRFAHSRIHIVYDDGTEVGTCSIHCAAIDLAVNVGKTPRQILVGDYDTRMLIDAEKAVWVIGGSKSGVMTRRAKWAFADNAAAGRFIAANGGTKAAFDDVMQATFEDMYQDIHMIREKKKMMKMKNKDQ